jgi:hypothetical protein
MSDKDVRKELPQLPAPPAPPPGWDGWDGGWAVAGLILGAVCGGVLGAAFKATADLRVVGAWVVSGLLGATLALSRWARHGALAGAVVGALVGIAFISDRMTAAGGAWDQALATVPTAALQYGLLGAGMGTLLGGLARAVVGR